MSEPKGRILVVDDDPLLLHMLVDTLTGIGYHALAARDGIEAMDVLLEDDRGFDVMITDVKMPNLDGIGLLKRVRRHFPHMPVLFITGVASDKMIAEASPDGYLSKPFRIARLEELIERALKDRRDGRGHQHARKVLINLPADGFREMLTEALDYSHYLPFTVAGGDEALEELDRGRFDVMITAFDDPAHDSNRIARIHTTHPELPLVAVSADLSPEEINLLRDSLPFRGFVRKPFTVGELLEVLDNTVSAENELAS
jgi:DNA-binding NtrC family response regulator